MLLPAASLPGGSQQAVCCQFLWSLERDSLLHLQGSSVHFLFLPPTVQARHAVLNFVLCVQPSNMEVLIPRAASFFCLWLCLALSFFALSIELTFDCELLLYFPLQQTFKWLPVSGLPGNACRGPITQMK